MAESDDTKDHGLQSITIADSGKKDVSITIKNVDMDEGTFSLALEDGMSGLVVWKEYGPFTGQRTFLIDRTSTEIKGSKLFLNFVITEIPGKENGKYKIQHEITQDGNPNLDGKKTLEGDSSENSSVTLVKSRINFK